MVSQPKNYIATFFTINIGMALFYAFSTHPDLWALIVFSVFFHISVVALMLLLAWVDPGIIPKIFSNYEHPGYRKIPISKSYLTGQISER